MVAIALASAMSGCGLIVADAGPVTTKSQTIPPFTAVSAENFVDVEVAVGTASDEAVLTCGENLFEHIVVENDGDTLVVRSEGIVNANVNECKMVVSTDKLVAVSLSGSGNVDVDGPVTDGDTLSIDGSGNLTLDDIVGEDVEVTVSASGNLAATGVRVTRLIVSDSASGNIDLDAIDAMAVDLRIDGSGDVTLAGEADQLDAQLSASGSLEAVDMPVTDATVEIDGSGDADILATGSVTGSLDASGDLTVHGGGSVSVSENGSRSVEVR
jgi:hypothetical protein